MIRGFEDALFTTDRENVGTQIGPYKLLQKIGEGGFGVVWLAEQLEPIRRRVALKIVKIGMDTDEVIARFEVERQALALMDHPNIAQVYDAGATGSGRPYFVMELVRGVEITRYCDENRLTPEARLRLFIHVCHAVQHAHQKGIIHRDLKPSNILVTLHDGNPVPKVIDFGIAKATDKPLTEKTLVTQFHAFVGTPAYTSPEQIEMSARDVDTRSDIYSLGVLLYELLAGRPPFDPNQLLDSGLEAMRRTIREIDPPRPSHRLGTLTDADRTSIAGQRSTNATKLSLLLRGDLDWIVMHCLEKNRTRRYETASSLARDVERHLAHEPVTARPPSVRYRAQKLFRRHKLATVSGLAIALSLVGGLAVSMTFLVRERRVRQRAVAAEKSAEKLRREAEAGRAAEALRASRTSLAFAAQLLPQTGHAGEGIAHLVRAARSDPANLVIGPRLLAALAYHSFAEPIGDPIRPAPPTFWVAYASDASRCVGISSDRAGYIFDLRSGRLLHAFPTSVAFPSQVDAQRDLLACTTPTGVEVWSLATAQKAAGPLQHDASVGWLKLSADGSWLATDSAGVVRIWETKTGTLRGRLKLDRGTGLLAFSPDNSRLLTINRHGPSWIWRVPDCHPLTSLARPAEDVTACSFSSDGRLIALALAREVQLLDAGSGKMVAVVPHSGQIEFTSDARKLVTTSPDGTAGVWDVPSGKPLFSSLPHGVRVGRPKITADDRYLLTTSNSITRVWDLTTGRLAIEPLDAGPVRETAVSPDGREFLTAGRDGIRRWRIAPGAARALPLAGIPGLRFIRSDPVNGAVLSAIQQDRIQDFDLRRLGPVGPPRTLPAAVTKLHAWAPDGRRLAVELADGVELWSFGGENITRRRIGAKANRGQFTADGARFAALGDASTLRVWNVDTGEVVATPPRHSDFKISPDGRYLALRQSKTVLIWDVVENRQRGEPIRQDFGVLGMEFSPDGQRLATAALGDNAQLWDVATTRPIGPPMTNRSFVLAATVSPDGRRLLTRTPAEVRLWDGATGAPLTEPLAGGCNVQHGSFNRDGTRFVTASPPDSLLRVWDSVAGELLADALPGSASEPPQFLPDGRLVCGAGQAVLSLPPSSGEPAPDWLLRLATTLVGGEIDAQAMYRPRPSEAKAFDALRRELAALPDNSPFVDWGRWLLADRAVRPIAPGFRITAAEVAWLAASPAAPVGDAR